MTPQMGDLMNRREFSSLLPALVGAPVLARASEAHATVSQAATPSAQLARLTSGQFVAGEAANPESPRVSHHYLLGMLPDNIRLEAHVTFLAPGAPPEKIEHHKHSEMWFVSAGTVTLMTAGTVRTLKAGEMGLCIAGDDHYITNASKTEPASYFVVAVGPPE
jgi:mannose-6-phosphate isomerase-like protein (cupin superfamily)